MRNPSFLPSVLLSVFAVAFVCGGCSTIIQGPNRKETESMLTTAGFKMSVADNAQELAALQSKPQRKVLPLQRNGKLYYGFTDAKGCGCAYLGDEAAYKQYATYLAENLAIDKEAPEHIPTDEPVSVITVYDENEWGAWGGDML